MRAKSGSERCATCGRELPLGAKAIGILRGVIGKRDFISLEEERYDLVIPDHFLNDRPVQVLLDLIRSPTLHRRVESLGGYDASNMGIAATTL